MAYVRICSTVAVCYKYNSFMAIRIELLKSPSGVILLQLPSQGAENWGLPGEGITENKSDAFQQRQPSCVVHLYGAKTLPCIVTPQRLHWTKQRMKIRGRIWVKKAGR